MSELHQKRRERLQLLMLENAIGAEELAFCIGKEPDGIDRLLTDKSTKITDRLARQIEQTFSKAKNWLDGGVQSEDNFDLFG